MVEYSIEQNTNYRLLKFLSYDGMGLPEQCDDTVYTSIVFITNICATAFRIDECV
jgi:hypothetical protein